MPIFAWNVLMGRFPQHERGLFDSTHLQYYTWHGWVELLPRAGFLIETLRCSGVPLGLAFPRWDGSPGCAPWNGCPLNRRAFGRTCSRTNSSSAPGRSAPT